MITKENKKSAISLTEAAGLTISKLPQTLIREFDIALVVHRLYAEKSLGSVPVKVRKHSADPSDISRVVRGLLDREIIEMSSRIPFSGLYLKPGQAEITAQAIACFADPLGYLSHLSAMDWHGLTDRRSKTIQLSSARGKRWTEITQQRAIDALTDHHVDPDSYRDASGNITLPGQFAWRNFDKAIARRKVTRYENTDWSDDIFADYDDSIRVSTVGYTFLDMVRAPDKCGGIYHVLDVFEEHAKRHRNTILKVVNATGKKIDKARVGYIMEEVVGIRNNITLDKWVSTAVQRGGSRKLDANNDYSPTYSERWCLSINI